MAVDQDLLDRIAATIADLYREVETALVRVVASELKKDLRADPSAAQVKLDAIRRLRAAAEAVVKRLHNTKSAAVREAIRRAYLNGRGTVLTDVGPWQKQLRQDARAAAEQVPNLAVFERLAAALHRDLGRVDQNILRAPVDAYRAVQAGAAARIASGAFTRRQASQAAWSRLIEQGITSFTDSANRRWRLSSYVEMMARTNIQRAATQGQTDRLAELGIDLVYVSDNVQECKLCRPFEGKVLRRDAGPVGMLKVEHATKDGELVTVHVLDTLTGARARGFQHPNCRHSISAYLPGITKVRKGTADPDGDKARQKQRYLERKIRAAKEAEVGALTPEAKKAAGAKVRAAQAAMRGHLAEHPDLKRLPYREAIGAGNIPRGEAPGGPVGDLTPPPDLPAALPAPVAAARPDPGPAPKQASKPKPKPEPEPRKPTLAEIIASGETGREKLTYGAVAETHKVTFRNGQTAIHKKVADSFTYTAKHQADAEELGAAVARAMGVRAPNVHRVGPHELYIEFMPGKVAGYTKRPKQYWLSEDGRRMALLHQLIDYADPHDLNWLVDKGRLVQIDFGLSFGFSKPYSEAPRDPRQPRQRYMGQFEKLFITTPSESSRIAPEWKDNDLSPEDIADVRRVLNQLRPRFEQMDRAAWHDAMMTVLEEIAQHAKGTTRWLPDMPEPGEAP